MKPHYLPVIDLLRGIAALIVCLRHLSWVKHVDGTPYLEASNPLKLIGSYGGEGVYIFFVVSGFLIPYTMQHHGYRLADLSRFMLRRSLRLDPAYFLRILSIVLIGVILPAYRVEPVAFSPAQIAAHLFYLNSFLGYEWLSPIFWTLEIEFQFYLLMAVIYPLLVHRNRLIRHSVLLLLASTRFLFLHGNYVTNYTPLFAIGILVFLYHCRINNRAELACGIAIVSLISYYTLPIELLVFSLFAAAFMLFVSYESRVTRFLARISYSLYLLHPPIGQRLVYQSFNYITHPVLRTLWVVATIGIAVLISWIHYLLVDRQAINWSKRISFGKARFLRPQPGHHQSDSVLHQ